MTNNWDIVLDQAFAAYNTGDFPHAEGLCREVLSAEPNHGDALFLMGLIAYRSGALEPAIDLMFRAVQSYPDIDNYRLTLASFLQKQGRLDEALTQYQKCPNHPMGLAQQGFIYLQKNQNDLGVKAFHRASELSPKLPEARLGLAITDQDLPTLKQVAEETNLPDAWYYLARLYQQKEEWNLALKAIEKTGLEQASYCLNQGIIYEHLEQWDEALKAYKKASELEPYTPEPWANQANIFRRQGDWAAAEHYYKRALAQDKDYIPARHNLADLMTRGDRVAEALEQYRTILSQNPNYEPALYNLAVILERVGEYAEAAGLYIKILLSDNPPGDIRWRLANTLALLAESNQKLAADFAKGWIQNFPKDPVAAHIDAAFRKQKETDITDYVRTLYDDFAATYDLTMLRLNAKAVEETLALIPSGSYAKALDLGCGTGAVGSALRGRVQNLTGVDLSEPMLAKAKANDAYRHLYLSDIQSFLASHKSKYDLITLVEVLEYLPDIRPIFQEIVTHLKKKGLFAFSIETTSKSEPFLSPNGRYLYPESYIKQIIEDIGITILKQKKINIRNDGISFAEGYAFLTQKS